MDYYINTCLCIVHRLANFTSIKADIFDNPCTTDLADPDFSSAVRELPDDFRFVHRRSGSDAADCNNATDFFVQPELCKNLVPVL
jgi:hypothetical protein